MQAWTMQPDVLCGGTDSALHDIDIVTDLLFVLYYLRLYKRVLLGYEVT